MSDFFNHYAAEQLTTCLDGSVPESVEECDLDFDEFLHLDCAGDDVLEANSASGTLAPAQIR